MTMFASDVCKISDSIYNALVHGERNMAVISKFIFSNCIPFLVQLPQIQEKQAATFKMYSNTLFLDFKFLNNILLH